MHLSPLEEAVHNRTRQVAKRPDGDDASIPGLIILDPRIKLRAVCFDSWVLDKALLSLIDSERVDIEDGDVAGQ